MEAFIHHFRLRKTNVLYQCEQELKDHDHIPYSRTRRSRVLAGEQIRAEFGNLNISLRTNGMDNEMDTETENQDYNHLR